MLVDEILTKKFTFFKESKLFHSTFHVSSTCSLKTKDTPPISLSIIDLHGKSTDNWCSSCFGMGNYLSLGGVLNDITAAYKKLKIYTDLLDIAYAKKSTETWLYPLLMLKRLRKSISNSSLLTWSMQHPNDLASLLPDLVEELDSFYTEYNTKFKDLVFTVSSMENFDHVVVVSADKMNTSISAFCQDSNPSYQSVSQLLALLYSNILAEHAGVLLIRLSKNNLSSILHYLPSWSLSPNILTSDKAILSSFNWMQADFSPDEMQMFISFWKNSENMFNLKNTLNITKLILET